jgi:calicheamicin 3'-O-methyl-rhamnosyltransferase
MRVLITTTPGTGHVNPVLPLADELRRAGHEVLWAIAEEGVREIRRHGFEATVAGMNVDERLGTMESRLAEIMSGPPRLRRGQFFAGAFACAAAPKMIRELGSIFDGFQPDLVVHEMAELGAAPLAMARGIPHVTVAFSGSLPEYAIPLLEEALAPVWAGVGFAPPGLSDVVGEAYFHPFPPSMGQQPSVSQVHTMRTYDIGVESDEVPEWIAELGQKRHGVYVTSGTTPIVATLAPWRPIFAALGRLNVDVLATIGRRLPVEELGLLPSNVRVERFVAQSCVLNRVAVVLSHAGAGTMLAAAREGVPQLVIPTWADQWENADAIVRTGSAILLEEGERDAATIQASVETLLYDASYRVAAKQLASEIAQMPTPADHVVTLEQLVKNRMSNSLS